MDVQTQLVDAEAIVKRIERVTDYADELYQELCLACLQQTNIDWSIPQEGRIVVIAKRLRANRFRQMSKRKECLLDAEIWEHLPACQIRKRFGVDDHLQLRSVLDRLPSNHRRAVEQMYLHGQPDEILATEENVNVETIRQWRSRGVRELRQMLCTS